MPDNQFKLFTEGDVLYEDMLDRLSAANATIELESYIFEPDAVGKRFIEVLIERAMQGVKVRMHLDAFGSLNLALGGEHKRITEAGIELKWYNPWCWYRPLKFNHRNHRKLLILDDNYLWLGGFNIHEENSLRSFGKDRWLDTHVRINGPLATHARSCFDQLWFGLKQAPAINTSAEAMILTNYGYKQRRQFRRALNQKFKSAHRTIWLCTPYFMPDRFMQNQIIRAARRGVDVRLLLPYKTDRPVARWAARAAYYSLINSGIRIFEYSPRFLHAKIIIIDGDWCTLGSTNIDYRSFFINLELNMLCSNGELIEKLNNIYVKHLSKSKEVKPGELVRNRWLTAIYQLLGNFCRRIL